MKESSDGEKERKGKEYSTTHGKVAYIALEWDQAERQINDPINARSISKQHLARTSFSPHDRDCHGKCTTIRSSQWQSHSELLATIQCDAMQERSIGCGHDDNLQNRSLWSIRPTVMIEEAGD